MYTQTYRDIPLIHGRKHGAPRRIKNSENRYRKTGKNCYGFGAAVDGPKRVGPRSMKKSEKRYRKTGKNNTRKNIVAPK